MPGVAVISEACIGTQDRARVDIGPGRCIDEFDPADHALISEAGDGHFVNRHIPSPDATAQVAGSMSYVQLDEFRAIRPDERVPDGTRYSKQHGGGPTTIEISSNRAATCSSNDPAQTSRHRS